MALVGLSFYEHAWVLCYIQPYPYKSSRTTTYMATAPLLLMAVVSTTLQILVYCKVRQQVRKSLKWTFDANVEKKADSKSTTSPTGVNLKLRLPKVFVNNMEAAVFWQSLSYLSTFYLCWVVMAIIAEFAHHQIWPLWVFMFGLSPLPGFLNFLVYVRPRILAWWEKRQKALETAGKKRSNTQTVSMISSRGEASVRQDGGNDSMVVSDPAATTVDATNEKEDALTGKDGYSNEEDMALNGETEEAMIESLI